MKKSVLICILISAIIFVAGVLAVSLNDRHIAAYSGTSKKDGKIYQMMWVADDEYLLTYDVSDDDVDFEKVIDGKGFLELTGGKRYEPCEQIRGSINKIIRRITLKKYFFVFPVILVIVGIFMFGLNARLVTVRLFSIGEIVLVLSLVAFFVFQSFSSYKTNKETIEHTMKDVMELFDDLHDLLDEDDHEYMQMLNEATGGNLYDCFFATEGEDGPVFYLGACGESGEPVSDYYEPAVVEAVQRALDNMEDSFFNITCGGYHTFFRVSVNWNELERGDVTCGVFQGSIMESLFFENVFDSADMILIAFFVLSFVLFVFERVYSNRYKKLVKTVRYAAAGHTDFIMPDKGLGGFTDMWKNFAEMNRLVIGARYGVNATVREGKRFIPARIVKLLGKKDISELKVGDVTKSEGTMVRFSIDGIKEIDKEKYMDVTGKCFEILDTIQENSEAIRINMDPDMYDNKYLFGESPDVAVSLAIEVSNTLDQVVELKSLPRLCVINTGEYVRGITGSSVQAVPFAYCDEDSMTDILFKSFPKLAGNYMIITERTMSLLTKPCNVRYIGYLENSEGRQLKVYECLDVYAEVKRRILAGQDGKFQEALKLFYSNDFYLARNAFSFVLQANPTDLITRWYLFRSEYCLNHEGKGELSHSLFAQEEDFRD